MNISSALRFLSFVALLSTGAPATLGASELVIESANGAKHHFSIELADTERSREMGLMFRDKLGLNGGMLFDFGASQPIAMWMKNTLIPLDMLFLAEDGRIVFIAERTVPHSLTPIGPREPVRAVLEIGGGQVSRLNIAPGDKVIHPMFNKN